MSDEDGDVETKVATPGIKRTERLHFISTADAFSIQFKHTV